MGVTSATVTTTTAANFIPELWSDGVIEAAQFASVFADRVNRQFESQLKVGDTLNIPRLSNLTTQSKSAGLSNVLSFEAVTETLQTVTVSTQEYAAFMIEGVVQVQANQDLRKHYERKIGYAVARGTEVTLANLIQNLTTNVVGTLGVEMTLDDYLSAYQKLGEAGILEDSPDPGDEYSLIVSWPAYVALMKIEQFINEQYKADAKEAMGAATVGRLLGAKVYRSNLLRVPASGQHDCVLMHKDCFALIVQEDIPVTSQYVINNLADAVAGWRLYGTARVLFPPETQGGGTAVDNRGVYVKTI